MNEAQCSIMELHLAHVHYVLVMMIHSEFVYELYRCLGVR